MNREGPFVPQFVPKSWHNTNISLVLCDLHFGGGSHYLLFISDKSTEIISHSQICVHTAGERFGWTHYQSIQACLCFFKGDHNRVRRRHAHGSASGPFKMASKESFWLKQSANGELIPTSGDSWMCIHCKVLHAVHHAFKSDALLTV